MATRGFFGRRPPADVAGRIPPGQSLTSDFPVLSAGPTPRIDHEDWSFTLKVGPRQVGRWSWGAFNALPQTDVTRDIHCVTKWSKLDTRASSASPATDVATWQTARIARIVPATPRVKLLELRPAAWAPFVAGQHLDFRLTAPDGYQAERSYSVSSAPEAAGLYEVAVELMPDGEVSPYFHEVAEVGDEVEIRGPFGGHFAWAAAGGGPLLLVGAGSGVAPLMSILRHRAAVAPEVPATLVYGVRVWEDAIFGEELATRDRDEAGLRVVFALSRELPRRAGDLGRRIDAAALAEELEMTAPRTTFVCGNNGFVEAVAAALVDLGVPPGSIRTERFGGA